MKSTRPKRIVKRKPTVNDENDYDSDEISTPVSNKSQKVGKKRSQSTQDSDYGPSCSQSQNLSPSLSQIAKEMTDYEKETMVDIAIKRIYTKYFGTQKTFKKTAMFLQTDKISSKNQSILIPMIAEKIKQKLQLDLIKDGDRYMFSLPKEFKKDYDSLTKSKTGDKTFCILTSLILSLIYSHKGHISEDLIHQRIKKLVPNLDTFNSPYKDIGKVLQELEQRAYTSKKSNPPVGDNPPTATVFWGYRAKIEIDKKALLPHLCMFFSASSPSELPIWLKEAVEENVDFSCE